MKRAAELCALMAGKARTALNHNGAHECRVALVALEAELRLLSEKLAQEPTAKQLAIAALTFQEHAPQPGRALTSAETVHAVNAAVKAAYDVQE